MFRVWAGRRHSRQDWTQASSGRVDRGSWAPKLTKVMYSLLISPEKHIKQRVFGYCRQGGFKHSTGKVFKTALTAITKYPLFVIVFVMFFVFFLCCPRLYIVLWSFLCKGFKGIGHLCSEAWRFRWRPRAPDWGWEGGIWLLRSKTIEKTKKNHKIHGSPQLPKQKHWKNQEKPKKP